MIYEYLQSSIPWQGSLYDVRWGYFPNLSQISPTIDQTEIFFRNIFNDLPEKIYIFMGSLFNEKQEFNMILSPDLKTADIFGKHIVL